MFRKHTLVNLFAILACLAVHSNAQASNFPPGVIATGTMGITNPPEPTMGTPINQSSIARLLSVNSIDDFCLFAPPTSQIIADSETFEVAWCTQPRNNARVIPDGTITGVSFLKTDFYVQIMGYGDFTKLNIPYGDYGGELDPHGATGAGNPIGGNVTSNITGSDQHFTEWMLYIDYMQFCLRVCTNANSTYSAAAMCWHELDEMGCEFVMPGNYNVNGTFETCEADVAYPPGWYPTATVNNQPVFSTFAQRFTGTLTDGQVYTVGDLATPSAAFTTPSSSNCATTATISNGIPLPSLGLLATGATTSGSGVSAGPQATAGSISSGSSSSGSSGSSTASGSTAASGVSRTTEYSFVFFVSLISGIGAIFLFY